MITEQDVITLTEAFKPIFATKEEFYGLQEIVGDLKVEMGELNDKFDILSITLNEKMDTMLIGMDSFTGSVRTLEQENDAGAAHLERHDRQLGALALATGITPPD